MFNGDYVDVNSAEMIPNSFVGTLKQTMMNQDLVFRTQVYELHRLYAVQKNLMNDFEKASFEELHMLNQNSDSTMLLVSSRNNINYISSGASSATSVGNFTKDKTLQFLPKVQSGLPETQQKLFGFQLPADEVNHHGSERKDCFSNFLRDKGKSENAHGNTCTEEEVKLSFHLINNNKRNHVEDKRKAISFPDDVTDLEIPNSRWSNSNRESSFFPHISPIHACGGDRDMVEPRHQPLPWFLRTAKNNLNHGLQDNMSYEITESRLPVHSSPNCQRQNQKVSDFTVEDHLQASGRVLDLDLNIAQLDTLSISSANSDVLETSRTSSESAIIDSGKIILKPVVDSSPVPFVGDSRKQNGPSEKYIQEGTCRETSCSGGLAGTGLDLERVPESPSHAGKKGLCSSAPDLRYDSVGSSLKDSYHHLHERESIDLGGPEHKLEKRASKKLCKKSSLSIESEITADINFGIECGDSNISPSIEVQKSVPQPQIENASTEQNERSPQSTTDSNNQLHTDKEEPADEMYQRVQGAAAALVSLSLDRNTCWLENSDIASSQKEEDDVSKFTLDSYEEMVLGLEESSPEDLTALSQKFDVSEPSRECGYKLKRGTRMKDFQKDILPSLSTLARREICEDINIMDGVIRSREYKKMRLKMGDVDNERCKQTRRRRGRGRVSYGRR